MTLPVVVLTRAGLRRLQSGHPWIFTDQVDRGASADAFDTAGGALVRLEAPAGVPRGAGVLNPDSRIPVRVVSLDPAFDEHGAPVHGDGGDEATRASGAGAGGAGAPGDGTWWARRLDAAVAARAERLAPGAEACRLVHAEADGLPGLVIDRYADVAVLQAGCAWADAVAPALAERLVQRHALRGVLARHDGAFRRHEKLPEGIAVLAGDVPDTVVWHNPAGPQGAVPFAVDLRAGQKTGGYLDQRDNQLFAARELPAGRALDVFSNDGGFALQLAAGGRQVTAVDSSAPALARLAENAAAAGLSDAVTTVQANAFEDLRARVTAGEQWDALVLDPPALTKSRRDVGSAKRGYKELNLRALRLLRPGGRLFTCSCSFHLGLPDFLDVLREAAADARRDVAVLTLRGAAPDHPNRLTFPESDYLKAVLLEVRGEL